ncbi:MAG: DUF3137 domain-containing protein [Bacteroidota bacterium]
MKRLDEFRLYYNHSIHPELRRMERHRVRLIRFLFVSVLLLIGVIALEVYINIPAITFFMMVPIVLYLLYLSYRIQRFRSTFKPNVINLILDFIDDGPNYGTLYYDAKRSIPKSQFRASRIFESSADQYKGEDHISGRIGELKFELCELDVKEFSRVRNRLNYVFKGVFMHATITREVRGSVIILPKEFKQYLSRSIKAATLRGAHQVHSEILDAPFEEVFMTYASPNANLAGLLSSPMQNALAEYRQRTGKEIYLSFLKNEIYIAVTEHKDILEPYIFQSNVSFDLVREFFEDINLLIGIVEDIDHNY